jgi:hypothetical protein
MSFFDKKEEVISIELTPYGRHLLSLGKLRPQYYAFFDDDVIYNIAAAGGTETSAQIKTRILDETPYLKPNYLFENLNDNVARSETYLEAEGIRYPSSDTKLYYLQKPIGTCKETSKESPAFKATFIQNSSSVGSKFLTGKQGGDQQVAQVDVNFDYTLSVKNQNKETNTTGVSFVKPEFKSKIFDDGTYVNVEFEKMIVQLLEDNGFNLTDSFEVEVFKRDEKDTSVYDQLKFLPKQRRIVDDILLDEEQLSSIATTPEYVEYYFDLLVDKEIAIADICEGVTELKARDIFVDIDIECPDLQGKDVNIYTSRITPSDIEVCD